MPFALSQPVRKSFQGFVIAARGICALSLIEDRALARMGHLIRCKQRRSALLYFAGDVAICVYEKQDHLPLRKI